MLEKIRVRRRSNEVISIGDVVNYRKATFVVINILSIKVVPRATGEFIYYDCLCQQLQTPDLSAYIKIKICQASTYNNKY